MSHSRTLSVRRQDGTLREVYLTRYLAVRKDTGVCVELEGESAFYAKQDAMIALQGEPWQIELREVE